MKNKKLVSLLAVICLFAVAVSTFIGCTKSAAVENEPTDTNENIIAAQIAQIISAKDGELLVTSDSGLYFLNVDKKTSVSKDGKALDGTALRPGMKIQIAFDGNILETYPARIANADTIKITAEEDDKISLYSEAVKHIFEEREGKDFYKEKLETVALDLTELSSLSNAEKNALEYVLRNYFYSQTEADLIRSSYEELSESGRLKDGEFKDGLIISVKSGKSKNSFSLSLLAGSLCGYGYEKCTAKLNGGEWKISYDGAWVS